MRQKRHLGHISTHFWHGSRPVVIGPHTKCMTSMTSMTSTARVRARSRAPYIRKLFFLIFIFSKFQSDCWYGLIQGNRKMPSEWLGVHASMGGGAKDQCLEGHNHPVQLYFLFFGIYTRSSCNHVSYSSYSLTLIILKLSSSPTRSAYCTAPGDLSK